MNGFIKMLIIFCVISMSGCAGVDSVYDYYTIAESSDWLKIDNDEFQTVVGDKKIRARIIGRFGDASVVGPIFIPLIPVYSDGVYITVKCLYCSNSLHVTYIELSADQGKVMRVTSKNVTQDGVYVFYFEQIDFLPKELLIKFDGVKVDDGHLNLLPLKIGINKEKCYWTGDSYPTYLNCKNAK